VVICSILGPILGTVVGFFAGWLSATERLRGEIYTRRLDMYQKLNHLASELLLISIKAEVESETYREKVLEARLVLSEFLVANALLVSARVGPLIAPMLEATLPPNLDKLRASFNATVETMAHDLRLNTIDRATKFLLPFEKPHKRHDS